MSQSAIKTAANEFTPVASADLDEMQAQIAAMMDGILSILRIDPTDPNVTNTGKRWAKMMVREAMEGRFSQRPDITTFPNTRNVDEVIHVGPIVIRSMCSHHLVPVMGKCWIGVIPGERLLGLSKYARIAHWVAARPQIQEEMAMQIADLLEEMLKPRGIALVIKATHFCMAWRGVKEADSKMVSSVTRGLFRTSDSARNEFLTFVGD